MMKKLMRNNRELKSVLQRGNFKKPVRKDPFEIDTKLRDSVFEMSNDINTLARKRNMLASEACRRIEAKFRTLLYRINGRNRVAAEKNRCTRWAVADDVKATCYEYGQIIATLQGRWNDGTEFDEDLSDENFDEALLKRLSDEYRIYICFCPGCFGK
jgi:hypothetical protein